MTFNEYSLRLRIENENLNKLKPYIIYGGDELIVVNWYSAREDSKYKLFDIIIKGDLPLEGLKAKAEVIKENFKLESIRLNFENKADVYTLLENKGFIRYQDVDFVEFKHKERYIALKIQPLVDTHILEVVLLDKKAEMDYAFKLIDRVIEIIDEEGER